MKLKDIKTKLKIQNDKYLKNSNFKPTAILWAYKLTNKEK